MASRKNYKLIEKYYRDEDNICFKYDYIYKKYQELPDPKFYEDGEDYLVIPSTFRQVVEWFNEGKLEEAGYNWYHVKTERLCISKSLCSYRKKKDNAWIYTIVTHNPSIGTTYTQGRTIIFSELELIMKELEYNQEVKIVKE